MVGSAIIRIRPRREAACSAPGQRGTIDAALQKRAIAFAIEQSTGTGPSIGIALFKTIRIWPVLGVRLFRGRQMVLHLIEPFATWKRIRGRDR